MTTTSIRKRLQEYIRFVDEKKVKAIYTMLEQEVNAQKEDFWTKELVRVLDKRSKEMESGKVKGKSSEDVLRKAESLIAKKK